MTLEQLAEFIGTTRHDLLRIETLPSYDTAITTSDFRRWLNGKLEPDWEARRSWLDLLRRWASEDRPRRRVRVIHDVPDFVAAWRPPAFPAASRATANGSLGVEPEDRWAGRVEPEEYGSRRVHLRRQAGGRS